jgi:hypothetical protein
MSNNRIATLCLITFGFIFQALFYNHGMGLNTLVFTGMLTVYLFLFSKKPKSLVGFVLLGGLYISTLGVIVGHTDYSLVIYWICVFFLLGGIIVPFAKFMHFAPLFALSGLSSMGGVWKKLRHKSEANSKGSAWGVWMRFVLIPFILVLVLMALYAGSNAYFKESIQKGFQLILNVFQAVSFRRFFFGILGIVIGSYFLITELHTSVLTKHQQANTALVRLRKNSHMRGLSKALLRKEQVAIVFFVLINLLAAWLNFLDIKHIWFGFKWDGGFLKEMVHEGTNMLIIAILISMGCALYYLNSNLVFLKSHQKLQVLITIWLAQNILMIVSVVFRNTYYIQYFGLAYKRIFVYFFLAACLVGLVSIIYKSIRFKSTTYLFAINTLSVYGWCVLAGLFNWDAIIVRYNFANYQSSFVHYDFLVGLNNASLPFVVTNADQLKQIDSVQTERFRFSTRESYNEINFSQRIDNRKRYFMEIWEESNWLDWNVPEAKAYNLLKQQ